MTRKVVDMLAITPSALEAIQGITSQPGVPEGAGLKISGQTTPEGTAVELSLAESPEESDQVLQAQDAHVFVAAPLTELLDDKVLDAEVREDQIAFRLLEQSPPDGALLEQSPPDGAQPPSSGA
ncbi:MAG: HesB/YadR/YfhF-family protein [Actinomycetota bacterium]